MVVTCKMNSPKPEALLVLYLNEVDAEELLECIMGNDDRPYSVSMIVSFCKRFLKTSGGDV